MYFDNSNMEPGIGERTEVFAVLLQRLHVSPKRRNRVSSRDKIVAILRNFSGSSGDSKY